MVDEEPLPPVPSGEGVPAQEPGRWGIEPPPTNVTGPLPEAPAAPAPGAEPGHGVPPLQPARAADVPSEILAEIRQSKELKGRRLRRNTPLHRMEIIKGIPLGDLILGVCGAMMALGVLGDWVTLVVDGHPESYTGLDLALRRGHLETLLVLASGLALLIAPFARSGTVLPVIRARQAATLLLFLTIFLVLFELFFAYGMLAAAYGPVEGLFPAFISDMGPGFWLSLLGSCLGLAALIAFRSKAEAPQLLGEVVAGGASVAAAPK